MIIDRNFIIETALWLALPAEDKTFLSNMLFQGKETNDPVDLIPDTFNMLDVLALAGIFKSKSDARKNWRGPVEIPMGFKEFNIGKRQHLITTFRLASPDEMEKEALPNSRVEDKRIDNVF